MLSGRGSGMTTASVRRVRAREERLGEETMQKWLNVGATLTMSHTRGSVAWRPASAVALLIYNLFRPTSEKGDRSAANALTIQNWRFSRKSVVDTTGYQFTTVHIKVRDRSNEQGASRLSHFLEGL